MQQKLLFAIGLLFTGLGIAGFILPVMPTTPFVLVASYCLIRSSPRVHDWLARSRWAGPVLHEWHHLGGVRPSLKIGTAVMVAISVGISACVASATAVEWVLAIGLVNLLFVLCLPTARRKEHVESEQPDEAAACDDKISSGNLPTK